MTLLGLAQSADIKDLGISGGMRSNFTIIGLDYRNILRAVSITEIPLETRRAILASISGIEYPAVAVINGTIEVLDRNGVQNMRPSRNALIWSVAPWSGSSSQARNQVETPISGQDRTDGRSILEDLADLMMQKVSREAARNAPYNRSFSNHEWKQARKLYITALEKQADDELLEGLLAS
jgi:hypothetical protein